MNRKGMPHLGAEARSSIFTFIKYSASSFIACLIDLLLFHVLCKFFTAREMLTTAGLYVSVATFYARLVSAFCNYVMNYRIVFHSDVSRKRSFSRYVVLAVVQVCISAFLVTLLHGLFGGEEVIWKLPVDLMLFFVNYFLQREIVYK